MSYFFWDSSDWFGSTLCCHHTVVQFGKLQLSMRIEGVLTTIDWHWALGLSNSGEFEVLGAWPDDGAEVAQRIAADLHHRGLGRVAVLVADDSLVAAVKGLPSQSRTQTVAELEAAGFASPRLQTAIRWTAATSQRLQERLPRATKKHGPLPDHAAAASFLAQAFHSSVQTGIC